MITRGIVWDSHGDKWNIQYIGAGAEATASLISDTSSEDDSIYKTRTFVLEFSGTLISRTKEEWAALKNHDILEIGGESVWVTARLESELLEVYRDSTISYEIVGRR